MKITEIQIIPIKANSGLIAFASVVFDGCLYLGSIGIHKRLDGNGYRLTYPTKRIGEKDLNIYHPINKETSKLIEDEIILKVEQLLG
jgi:stage V sporulation protein G